MSVIFDQYSERLRRKRRSPHSISGFATASTRLDRWLQAQGVAAEEATFPQLEDYFDCLALELKASTAGVHLRWIQGAYNYALLRGTIKHNPALDIEVPQDADSEPIIIPNHCLRVIKERAIYRRDWVFFHLLAYTGMRRSEIRSVVYDDGSDDRSVVKLEEQTIRVIGKGGKLRLVPIHPALGEVLAQENQTPGRYVVHSDGKHGVAAQTIDGMTKRLSPTYTPHDFRRTVATSLARNGVPDRVIDRIMGWSKRTVRDRYYVQVAQDELLRGILHLYRDDPV